MRPEDKIVGLADDPRYRVFRVLEYVGPRKWVDQCLALATIQGVRYMGGGQRITGTVLGYPEIMHSPSLGDEARDVLTALNEFLLPIPPDLAARLEAVVKGLQVPKQTMGEIIREELNRG